MVLEGERNVTQRGAKTAGTGIRTESRCTDSSEVLPGEYKHSVSIKRTNEENRKCRSTNQLARKKAGTDRGRFAKA